MSQALHALMASQTVKAIATLSNYQQITLCAAVKLYEINNSNNTKNPSTNKSNNDDMNDLKKKNKSDKTNNSYDLMTTVELYRMCVDVCTRDARIPPMTYSDYCCVLSTLTDMAMIRVIQFRSKSNTNNKNNAKNIRHTNNGNNSNNGNSNGIILRVTRDDIKFALSGSRFFQELLSQ